MKNVKNYKLFVESLNWFNKHKTGKQYTWEECKNKSFDTEPLTLEDTIQFCIKWYPTLHGGVNARERALDTIYLAIGGNYEWDDNGRRTEKFEDGYTDEGMIKQRRSNYDLDYHQKERKDEIKQLQKSLVDYENMLSDYTTDSTKWIDDIIERDHIKLQELLAYDAEFDPHYHKYWDNEKENPITKIPWGVSISQVTNVPENAQRDYVEGLYEIIDFFAQSKFKGDNKYKIILEMKKALKQRFNYL